jgi:hypothetical protein
MSAREERQEQIKREIAGLLSEYAGLDREGAYVGDWVISSHVQSVGMAVENRSEVWTCAPTGQPWPMTWGLLMAGFETEKAGMRDEGP